MTGLWMPALLEDGNGNLDPKGGLLFTNVLSNENTEILNTFPALNK